MTPLSSVTLDTVARLPQGAVQAPAALEQSSGSSPARKVGESGSDWEPAWAPALLKLRPGLILLWVMIQVAAFNGQWRLHPDSALYRSVAHSLASGEGYAVLGKPETQVYPGLPILLAGLEIVFGPAAWPAIVVMILMAAGALCFTYLVMRRIGPPWLATVTTLGVALNREFIVNNHQLLTDTPFLLGLMMSLWGWEALTDNGWRPRLRGALCLASGLVVAASMRPTFWILAVALFLACVGGLLATLFPRLWTGADRPRSWRFYAAGVAVVLVSALLFAALDPRTRSLQLGGGDYETEMVERAMQPLERLAEVPARLWRMLEENMEEAFFAVRIEGVNLLIAALLLTGIWQVGRRRPLWAMIVGLLLVTMLLASSHSRYFIMVMPFLWLGWVLLSLAIARRFFRDGRIRSWYILLAWTVVVNCNLGYLPKFIREQHVGRPKEQPVYAMADLIRRVTRPGDVIIGTHTRELTYLTGRRVVGVRELFDDTALSRTAKAYAVRDSGAEWAIFPTSVYYSLDRGLYQFGRQGVFVPKNRDDSTVYSAGVFGGVEWYLTREWAIDETMLDDKKP